MRKLSFLKMAGGLLIGGLALNACVDDKYTFDDLDKTMKFGEGTITLPASSTGDIEFSNLFEIKEGGAITMEADPNGRKDNNGNLLDSIYYLNSSGNSSSTRLDVEEIKISVPDVTPISINPGKTATPPYSVPGLSPAKKVKGNAPGDGGNAYYNFLKIEQAKTTINRVESGKISDDVVSISDIVFEPGTSGLEITLSIQSAGVLQEIFFDSLQLNLPVGIGLGKILYTATAKSGTLTSHEGIYDSKTGKVSFFGPYMKDKMDIEDEYGLDVSKMAKIHLEFDTAEVIDEQAIQFDKTNHKASFGGEVSVHGAMRVKLGAISFDNLANNIGFKADVDFIKPQLSIHRFSGEIKHALSQIDPIEINDLPDFLTDPQVKLNLYNPQLFLKLTLAGVKQKIVTDLQLTSYDENKNEIARVELPNLTLHGEAYGGQDVMLTHLRTRAEGSTIPEDYIPYAKLLAYRDVENLPSLLSTVPHTIKVGGIPTPENGNNDNLVVNVTCKDVHLPINCPVDLDYKIYAPLAFDSGFKIVYKSEESNFDLGDDMDQIDFGQIIVTGKAESDIPMDLSLSATALSNEKNIQGEFIPIPQMIIRWQEGKMNAKGEIEYPKAPTTSLPLKAATLNSGSIQKTSTYFRLILTPADKFTMSDILAGNKEKGVKKLDGLSYTATMDNALPGQSLKTSQHLKLTDLTISLDGGFTYTEKDK